MIIFDSLYGIWYSLHHYLLSVILYNGKVWLFLEKEKFGEWKDQLQGY